MDLLKTNFNESIPLLDSHIDFEECDIPEEIESSPISTPIPSKTVSMGLNVLLKNKGHLKKEDKLEFSQIAQLCKSTRIVPPKKLSGTNNIEQVSGDRLNVPRKKLRKIRSTKSKKKRSASHLIKKTKRSKITGRRKSSRATSKVKISGFLSSRRIRVKSIDQTFTKVAFAPMYTHLLPPVGSFGEGVQANITKMSQTADDFVDRGVTMKDIFPLTC
eukprot:CAMPEP_0205806084 /NCGR_PEP_ID=MMETSP0205-20121125/9498_1 /ASSEMBLY_ACC=CAM_ASM_000278 /TAXON_ID=36767 /ORGANISM="Euplotes focardii, Strain TN1" /LENGTH=216 /DNA_ID=CAMNT_0053078329 /DNA_START=116 /DNA_END=766 /DNA_ORIENTATION=-